MHTVTAIKQQLKKQQYYSIFVDGEFSFSVSENQLVSSGLHKGDILTDEQLESCKEATNTSKAYAKALHYLSFRPRSVHEVERHLLASDYTQAQTSSALETLAGQGYLNDAAFARSWIESRQSLKFRSKRVLIQELAQKGIQKDIAEQALADLPDEVSDTDTIQALIEKKRLIARYPVEQKLISYLLSQGFAYSDVRQALAAIAESTD